MNKFDYETWLTHIGLFLLGYSQYMALVVPIATTLFSWKALAAGLTLAFGGHLGATKGFNKGYMYMRGGNNNA